MVDLKALKRKPATVTEFVGARVDAETKAWILELCEREGISVSALICKLIEDFKALTD